MGGSHVRTAQIGLLTSMIRTKRNLDTVVQSAYLDAVPYHSHRRSVDNRPEGTPDAKGGTIGHGKGDAVNGTHTAHKTDEQGGDGIANPDTQPGLPPRKTVDNHRRGDHPRVLTSG